MKEYKKRVEIIFLNRFIGYNYKETIKELFYEDDK